MSSKLYQEIKQRQTVHDIQSYCVFANIDDRKGTIKGHMLLLTKEQYQAIEDIVLSGKIKVKEDHTYEVQE